MCQKTKLQTETVISLCFHVASDWLLHNGKCQNQIRVQFSDSHSNIKQCKVIETSTNLLHMHFNSHSLRSTDVLPSNGYLNFILVTYNNITEVLFYVILV